MERGTAALEDEAVRRAYHGVEEPVFYKGVQCGTVTKYSDKLLIMLLKARNPAKYREGSGAESARGQVTLNVNIVGVEERAGAADVPQAHEPVVEPVALPDVPGEPPRAPEPRYVPGDDLDGWMPAGFQRW
jgi:hypothetical protein